MIERPTRLLTQAVRFVHRRPGEALLLARMAGWVLALSLLIKLLPLPRVLRLVTAQPRNARRFRPNDWRNSLIFYSVSIYSSSHQSVGNARPYYNATSRSMALRRASSSACARRAARYLTDMHGWNATAALSSRSSRLTTL